MVTTSRVSDISDRHSGNSNFNREGWAAKIGITNLDHMVKGHTTNLTTNVDYWVNRGPQ